MNPVRALFRDRIALAVVSLLLMAAVVLVGASLRAPEIETFAPTPPDPVEQGDLRVGPRTVTVDASGAWRYFDFSRGSVVEGPGPLDWDVAFSRFRILTNGGAGFGGQAGVLPLGHVPFDSVTRVPDGGYTRVAEAADSVNPALERWYDYSFTSHLLRPKPVVYALRTADGRYAKLEILGYYCPGAQPGCVTFRYVYQGDGGTDVGG